MLENTGGLESSRTAEATSGCNQRRNRGAAVEADTIGEQLLKETQLGSSSPSRHNRGAAVEADAIGEPQFLLQVRQETFTC